MLRLPGLAHISAASEASREARLTRPNVLVSYSVGYKCWPEGREPEDLGLAAYYNTPNWLY